MSSKVEAIPRLLYPKFSAPSIRFIFLSCCLVFFVGSHGFTAPTGEVDETAASLRALADKLPAFDEANPHRSEIDIQKMDENVGKYFHHYGLHIPETTHFFGGVSIGGYTIAAHAFPPSQPKGTVIIVHGYFDHAGVMKRAQERLPNPVHVVAHSVGSGIVTEYLLTEGLSVGQCVVLVAPNIRSSAWSLSRITHFLFEPFVGSVRRIFRPSSKDKEFLEFRKNLDPLQFRYVPITWFEALLEWNGRMEELGECDAPLMIIQGDSDDTVDFRYNIDFYQERFPNLDLIWIDNGEHPLLNEVEPVREEVLSHIGQRWKPCAIRIDLV